MKRANAALMKGKLKIIKFSYAVSNNSMKPPTIGEVLGSVAWHFRETNNKFVSLKSYDPAQIQRLRETYTMLSRL